MNFPDDSRLPPSPPFSAGALPLPADDVVDSAVSLREGEEFTAFGMPPLDEGTAVVTTSSSVGLGMESDDVRSGIRVPDGELIEAVSVSGPVRGRLVRKLSVKFRLDEAVNRVAIELEFGDSVSELLRESERVKLSEKVGVIELLSSLVRVSVAVVPFGDIEIVLFKLLLRLLVRDEKSVPSELDSEGVLPESAPGLLSLMPEMDLETEGELGVDEDCDIVKEGGDVGVEDVDDRDGVEVEVEMKRLELDEIDGQLTIVLLERLDVENDNEGKLGKDREELDETVGRLNELVEAAVVLALLNPVLLTAVGELDVASVVEDLPEETVWRKVVGKD